MENEDINNEGAQPEVEKTTGEPNDSNSEGLAQAIISSESNSPKRRGVTLFLHGLLIFVVSMVSLLFLIAFVIYIVPVLQETTSGKSSTINNKELKKDSGYKKQTALITKDIQRLSRKFNSYTSGQTYIVINTTDNRFFLYKNKILVREGSCSTGKLLNLKTEKGRSWVFRTPKGKRLIQNKRTNPAWHKPDWAFIEEGVPVPPKDSPLRWEANVLGDYAMDIGDSYMIHGTIYKRQLGMPVTHGCVRLNDEDLEAVYNTLNIGSKVYIF